MRHSAEKPFTHRQVGAGLAVFALLLITLALPQTISAWLTAPKNLDHTHETALTPARAENFTAAMKILPEPETAKSLVYYYLTHNLLSTPQRARLQQIAMQAVRLSPSDPYHWYYLAATLEPEIFDPARLVLFDQALTMSLMTGPHTRDLILPRAMMLVRYGDRLSQPLRDAMGDQIISLWAASPADLRSVYLAMPPEGQKLIFDTLDQIPGESLKFNQFLDHPDQLPQGPDNASDDINSDDNQ